MSRIRTIKPQFFTDDELAELPLAARLLFAGLFCLADRRGRLEDRPRKIKAEVMPYDDHDVDALLWQLHQHRGRFITRYEVDGKRFIQVRNFEKHQHCHVKEPDSSIPAPDGPDASTVPAPDGPDAKTSGREGNRKGKEGEEQNLPPLASLVAPKGAARQKFVPPSVEEVADFAMEKRLGSMRTVSDFHDHFTANGWMTGKNSVKDWKAAYRRWVRREPEFNRPPGALRRPTGSAAAQELIRQVDEYEARTGGSEGSFGNPRGDGSFLPRVAAVDRRLEGVVPEDPGHPRLGLEAPARFG